MPKVTAQQRMIAKAGLVAAGALFLFCLTVLFLQGREPSAASASPMSSPGSSASLSLAQR
jgi:hypothetical protein